MKKEVEILEFLKNNKELKLEKECFTKKSNGNSFPVDRKIVYNLGINDIYYLIGEITEEEKLVNVEIDLDRVPYNNYVYDENNCRNYVYRDKETTQLQKIANNVAYINQETLNILIDSMLNNNCEMSDYCNLMDFITDFNFEKNSEVEKLNNKINSKLIRIKK